MANPSLKAINFQLDRAPAICAINLVKDISGLDMRAINFSLESAITSFKSVVAIKSNSNIS
jgi:hypothetical protein